MGSGILQAVTLCIEGIFRSSEALNFTLNIYIELRFVKISAFCD